jgi:hypothetical protein
MRAKRSNPTLHLTDALKFSRSLQVLRNDPAADVIIQPGVGLDHLFFEPLPTPAKHCGYVASHPNEGILSGSGLLLS